jgi:hypothetical protein
MGRILSSRVPENADDLDYFLLKRKYFDGVTGRIYDSMVSDLEDVLAGRAFYRFFRRGKVIDAFLPALFLLYLFLLWFLFSH